VRRDRSNIFEVTLVKLSCQSIVGKHQKTSRRAVKSFQRRFSYQYWSGLPRNRGHIAKQLRPSPRTRPVNGIRASNDGIGDCRTPRIFGDVLAWGLSREVAKMHEFEFQRVKEAFDTSLPQQLPLQLIEQAMTCVARCR
jgi:hypothetical protein